jgi:hypothetical protein
MKYVAGAQACSMIGLRLSSIETRAEFDCIAGAQICGLCLKNVIKLMKINQLQHQSRLCSSLQEAA